MKKKVSDLEGADLDYWVAKAEGFDADWKPPEHPGNFRDPLVGWFNSALWKPCARWEHGGTIIERERIGLNQPDEGEDCEAWMGLPLAPRVRLTGATPLIAAMRCYVSSRFGEEVGDE